MKKEDSDKKEFNFAHKYVRCKKKLSNDKMGHHIDNE